MDNMEFLAEFGNDIGLGEKKASNGSTGGGDLLSSLLSVTKNKPQPIKQQASKPKKKEEDVENSHEYFKRALKPIKGSAERPKLFTPKNESKEVSYQQKIKQAKHVLENKSKQKKYKPKVVDYLGVGDWNNFKKQGNDKPKSSRIDNQKKQKQKDISKRRFSSDEPRNSSQRQKLKDRNKQSRRVQEERLKEKQQQRQRERQKQRQRQKRERSREKQRQRIRQKQRQAERRRQKQKQQRGRERQSQRERQRERQRRQKELKQRQAQRQRRFKEHKKKRYHDEDDDYKNDGFVVDDDEEEEKYGWKKDLSKLLNTKKRAEVYAIRDQEEIAESSARRILGEDKISARVGRQEEEADWRREEQEKRRKAEKRRREEERRGR